MKQTFYSILFLSLISCGKQSANAELITQSPDKTIEHTLSFASESGKLSWTLSAYDSLIIRPSDLGFQLADGSTIPSKGWQAKTISDIERDTVWNPVWGKRQTVADRYREITMELSAPDTSKTPLKKLNLQVRLYDDGLAFRYIVPSGEQTDATQELTSYQFSDDYTAWFYNGENHNIGPVKLSSQDGVRLPVATIKVSDSLYLAMHEAELAQGDPLKLNFTENSNRVTIASFPGAFGKLHQGFTSAWRVVMVGKTPGSLVDSHLIELLNPEPAGDFSWVRPGVAVWDWRIDGALWEGFKYGMDYPSWVRMVDFAKEQGFTALVLDANWYGPEHEADSDPIKGDKATDVQRILNYGNEKGIGVWLYLNDVGGRQYPIEQTLAQYAKWGAVGIKYGFMSGTAEEKNLWTRKITQLCAENRMSVDFHDNPVHPYGQMRTMPNALTREFCHAQLDAHRVFTPSTFVTSVFVNMLAGPIDMNNGFFDLRQGKTTRVDENQPIPTTVVSEAARTLITFSGATILPDIPEYYRQYPTLLEFISAQKMPWRESKTLKGEIGEYIVMMRQSGDTYLVAAATNEQAREIEIPLTFLDNNDYVAQITEDGDDAHYLTNKIAWKSSQQNVNNTSILKVKLAPGGGTCILLKRK